MIKIIATNILVLIGLLIAIELGGQIISLVKNKKLLFVDGNIKGRRDLFEPHPYLSITLKKNVNVSFDKDLEYHSVRTTELGTRWTGADLSDTGKIRIACIGGSTTFCTGVNDEDSWPALLQKKLGDRYAVVNYGVPAYKTSEAIIQLAFYIPEIKPDFVIVYQGWNDMYNYHLENIYPTYFKHAEELMPMALLGVNKYESFGDKIKRKSGLFYLINVLKKIFYTPVMPEKYDIPDLKVDTMFVRNLRTISVLTTSLGAKEIVIPQVLNPFSEREELPWSIRLKQDAILPMMDRMNEFSRNVCASRNTCLYVDLKNDIQWKPEHFWDDMHFTKEGNELFSDALVKVIAQESVIDR